MTTRQLAERLGVNQSRIVRIEQTEISGATSLKALKAAANAMDCELIYAVVPKKTLQEILEERAYRRAERLVRRVLQNMSLEDQSPSKRSADEMIRARTKELLDGSSRRLWERDKP